MKTLSPIELPLNCTALIEASAGTGKTFTMANLYLRLLLGIGCTPLTVEQILVVTFTKAATEELRDRIRKNIKACRTFLQEYDAEKSYDAKDFFFQLGQQLESVEEAILRLRIAEREIDLASIFTIHSFCQKMLFQFAFDSGMRFDSDLQPDESDLLRRLSEEVWREMFYPMGLTETAAVAEYLGTPDNAFAAIRVFVSAELPLLSDEQHWLNGDLATHLAALQHFLVDAKQHWLAHGEEISRLIETELAKKYKTGEKKALNRRSYQTRYLEKWRASVDEWAASSLSYLPEEQFERFCQDFLNEKAEEGAEPLVHPHFAKNQQILTAYQQQFANKQKPLLLYQFLLALRKKLADYKATHSEKSFNDMLSFLNQALKGERGTALAAQIQAQFPFAMIDEFQDTDKEQYEIFHKVFMQEAHTNHGFIMIGDPKQSIYRFRGADIFTYLTASQQAQQKRTLAKNWRSLPPIVSATNRLFEFPAAAENSPFLYQGIQFHSVEAKESEAELIGADYVNCYLQAKFDEKLAAKQCAYQIQQQLKQMEAGEFGLKFTNTTEEINAFQAKDIAILVRSHSQATLIKSALAELGIRSVFLSEKESVYQSETAKELLWVLYACLNPYHQTNLLSALGTTLWGLSATEIHQLKNSELLWDEQVGRFIAYQQIWQQQGILPMLHKLFMQEGIIERLRANPRDSDRRLTDLLHLTELLQNAMPSLENESALVRWYERQLAKTDSTEEHILRLESEEELIKIVTIHGSKGLQYPIVWLPFIGKKNQGSKASNLAIYRDEQGQAHWYFGKPSEEVQALMDQEELAEDLRLLYVAVTRAESQLNLILPQRFEDGWNAVHYLLSNGEIDLDKSYKAEISTSEYLQQKGIDCQAVELDEKIANDEWRPTPLAMESLSACHFTGQIQQTGLVTSFSALHQQHEWAMQHHTEYSMPKVFENAGQDYDQQQVLAPETDNIFALENEGTIAYSSYQFPHSTKVGNILHSFFEHNDFQQAVDFEQILTICEQLGLDENWHEPLQQWFERVLATPFSEAEFALKDVPMTKRLNEWQFYLRLKNSDGLRQLNQLLKQYSAVSAKLPELNLPQLEGYIRGFVDCIVQMHGKFYLIDYKSNFLGYLAQDYSRQNLEKTIGQYRYDLQYLLYTLALHRYLRVRLGEQYEYERDFGGVAYLFLRGMNGTPNSGVFFEKPCKQLIEGMDEIFG
ncbi:exodeoxyribonuclease V subunit beta [Actinobacillus equuli]|uniref:RecBCD enzyme subunit RecB n=1 Tax=Actinobacillus equuli TaxID=718 RepID=A0AAX3FLB1_ACTEU|nr:exodeoxyribonuclease V subunit beta [Actinobacillus equuli]AIZ78635.1 exodeoxyribonuclease V subunit beta [Actinobacillus equuli subsp. equuli]WGE44897.1 exodeoxyribonuclease V subunit beta [Actinobacillus equuli subsp. equuli]VEE92741.1 exodeoxyribonuclease V subunit beta [Actinobacillus equuli]